MLKEKLQQLNFTPNQADVYLALLELGESKVGPLIKKTNFHRNIVYRALDDLIAQKLVSRITRRGVFYYSILNPDPLIQNLKSQEEIAKDVIKEIKSQKKPSPSEMIILSGEQGMLDIYEMIIQQGEDVYLIGATFTFPTQYKSFIPLLKKAKTKKKIVHYAVAQPQAREHKAETLKTVDHLRFLPKNFPASPMVLWISGNIVGHIMWETPPVAFLIKNKKIADNYREYFQLLWKMSSEK
ncbi:hypothetical protein HQ571_04030 [Candidatus Kuenenbacteria bacterium]|nr:hypothetical protein [Candidatus Kuenenbacteria bacterium]